MFDTKKGIFCGKLVITIKKIHPFLEESDFLQGKENVDIFSVLVWYPLEQPNATHLLTIFVKQKITKNFKNSMLKCNK